ncbi:MAG: hypothetical protein H7A01_04375 [Hahellaceae bacterium]|nr:hypothetical protein [Hahellaceae bacterium]
MQKSTRCMFLSNNHHKASVNKNHHDSRLPHRTTRLAENEIDWELNAQHALRTNGVNR